MNRKLRFDSEDIGVYIAGDGVYNAPERDYEMVTIPGRNGNLAIDHGRYENIEVTYPAFIWADSQADFRQKIADIRGQLTSKLGYRRLEDTYHPDEYRMGIYRSGLEVDPVYYNRAGEFELTFDCKPQRFLFSGEEVFTLGEWGETETYSGSIVSFDGTETTAIKSLKVNITPKQSGTGDPSPSNVRPISGWDSVTVHVSATTSGGSTITTNLPQTVYGGVLDVVSGKLVIDKVMEDITNLSWSTRYTGSVNKLVVASMVNKYYPQNPVDLVGEMGKYIGYVAGASILQNVDSREVGYYTYRGSNNIPEVTLYMILPLDATPSGKVVFNAMAPTEIQLTPTEVNTLLGANNIWADAGTVDVEVGENPNILTNPTPFTAQPVFEVEGSGTLTVNNSSMTIANNGTTVIDSEMMEAYEEENGAIVSRNDMVSGEFPTLKEGNNNIGTVGLTSVKITPRWWRL